MNSTRVTPRPGDLEALAKKVADFERLEKSLNESKSEPGPEIIHELMTCIAELEAIYDKKRSQQKEPVPALLTLELAQAQLYLATLISQCPRTYLASVKYPKNIFLAPIYHCECALFYAEKLHKENPTKVPLIQDIFNCLITTIGATVNTLHKTNHKDTVMTSYTGCEVINEFFQKNRGALLLFGARLERGMSHFNGAVKAAQLSQARENEMSKTINSLIKLLRAIKAQGGRLHFFGNFGPGTVAVSRPRRNVAIERHFFYPASAKLPEDKTAEDNSKYFHPATPRL